MRIEWTSTAKKDLRKIAVAYRTRILAKVEQFAADPAALAATVKAIKGSDLYRLRVADYRVIDRIEEDGTVTIMVVTTVRHRRDAYD